MESFFGNKSRRESFVMPTNNSNEHDVFDQVLSYSKKVRKESEEISNLSNGALAGFLTGTIAAGVVFGGAWWILAAVAAGPAIVRLSKFALFYREEKLARINQIKKDDIRSSIDLAVDLHASKLPDDTKQAYLENILHTGDSILLKKQKQPITITQDEKI